MTDKEFRDLHTAIYKREKRLLEVKGKLYAQENNRLVQFDRIAEFAGLPQDHVILTLMSKHFSTLRDIIVKGDFFEADEDLILELIGDIRNYLLLLYALWKYVHS